MAGVRVLEDEPNLNAGSGAALRLDGSAELDAAVMTSRGSFGAVASISDFKNPSLLARAVMDTPHRLLTGPGASRFARSVGIEPGEPRTEAALARHKALITRLRANEELESVPELVPWSVSTRAGSEGGAPFWQSYLPPAPRQAPPPSAAPAAPVSSSAPADAAAPPKAAPGGDTVGVIFRCGPGDYAGAASSGGPWLALPGRIGDVPVPGAALYVGDAAAVLVTGPGEAILTRMLARAVYERLAAGASADATLSWAGADFKAGELVVAILDETGAHVGPGIGSAWAALDPTLRTSAKADRP